VNNIKMDLIEIGWVGMDWIDPAQDRVEVSCEHGNEPSVFIKCWDYFLSGCAIGSFSRRAQLHEWVIKKWFYSGPALSVFKEGICGLLV
jgi:hypothetical protein